MSDYPEVRAWAQRWAELWWLAFSDLLEKMYAAADERRVHDMIKYMARSRAALMRYDMARMRVDYVQGRKELAEKGVGQ